MSNVVTRVAPSPTGRMHIGTARTALFNFLYARHHSGKFIVRIEDTNPARDRPEYEQDILDNLAWLGIKADEIHRQSEQNAKHVDAIRTLLDSGRAYVSREPAKNDPSAEVEVIRFKNPNTTIRFTDLLHGDISVDTKDLGDFVIARSHTSPVHHLAVVVDDAEMGVTLAMRGEDLLSNTPRQILIQEALGYQRPEYAHLPLILAPDRTKLSKRRHAVSVGDYRERGYLSEALVNFLAFLGWNPGTPQELFSMQELIDTFDIPGIQKSPAIFNEEKLRWFNREYLHKISDGEFLDEIVRRAPEWKKDTAAKLVPLMRERMSVWGDFDTVKADFEYFFSEPVLDPAKIPGKGSDAEIAKKHLVEVGKLLRALPSSEEMTSEQVKDAVWGYAEKEGRGAVLWPLRYALTGRERSPDPFVVAAVVGKEACEKRLATAIQALGN